MMPYELLRRPAAARGETPALIEGDRVVTYRRLLEAADALARRLREHGLGPDTVAATRTTHSIECVVALFAMARIGATNLLIDSTLKAREIERYCSNAGGSVLLWTPAAPDEAVLAGPNVLPVPPVEALDAPERAEPAAIPAERNLFLLLSSGTAGPPKIVPKTKAQADASVRVFAGTVPYLQADNVLSVLPFSHTFGLFNVLLAAIAAGATVCLERYSPRQTAAAVGRHRITVLPATPFMFRMMAETDFRAGPDFSSVRLAVSVGSALAPSVAGAFREKFGAAIAQSYGTTETGPIAIGRLDERADGEGWVGTLYEGVTAEIRGPGGEVLGAGQDGEIAVKSPANARGYLHSPAGGESPFRGPWFLTGDVGRIDQAGRLFVLGRSRPMINVAGKKVAPAEVEACLRGHPCVADAVVTAEAGAEGEQKVKATVVARGQVTARQLQAFCGARLADFKVPRRIVFVDSVSRGPMDKARPARAGEGA